MSNFNYSYTVFCKTFRGFHKRYDENGQTPEGYRLDYTRHSNVGEVAAAARLSRAVHGCYRLLDVNGRLHVPGGPLGRDHASSSALRFSFLRLAQTKKGSKILQ
jgi:hypothetical protein